MITKFKIFEVFNTDYDIRVLLQLPDEFKCEFTIDGDDYFFHARDENKMFPEFIRYGWHLIFGIIGPDKYKLTGKGIPFKVLSAVKKCFDMFMKDYQPEKISFIAEGETKASVYLKIFTLNGDKIEKRDSGLESFSEYPAILYMIDK